MKFSKGERGMHEQTAEIIINSKYKNAQYHMYSNKILVKVMDETYFIELPHGDKFICFYDMYYAKDYINVIVATRGAYDMRYILDENKFELVSEQLSK